MNDLAIKIEHVSKQYRLGLIGGGTLKGDIQSLFARMRGQEDPNVKIGVDQAKIGERFLALNDVSFDVKKGEALGIIGHNGAGKSTLLKLLSRVTAPTKGRISFNGRITSMLEVGTGFHPELTGIENIYMNGAILGMTKSEIKKRLDEIVEFSELKKFIDTPVKRYSSGMYVKLGFSVASHLDSEIMIMDEVLAVGDMKFQQKCLTRMREAAEHEGRTVLYVSHNMNTIRQLCSRCVVLDHGKVAFDGDTEEAIGYYLANKMNYETHRDYTDFERPSWVGGNSIRLLSAEYVGKDSCLFSANDLMHVRMKVLFNKDVNNFSFRLAIQCSDWSNVAMSFVHKFISGKSGETSTIDFDFDISALAPGNYQPVYVFFSTNTFGSIVDEDWCWGLGITKDKKFEDNIPWSSSTWGHIELPEPRVEISSDKHSADK